MAPKAKKTASAASTPAVSPAPTPAPASGKKSARKTAADYPDIVVTTASKRVPRDTDRDILVEDMTLMYHGVELVKDSTLNLAYGQRYGLLGQNGAGKTTLLRAVAARMLPMPRSIDVYSVEEPIEASDMSALEAVLEVDEERNELEAEAERLSDLMTADGCSDEDQAVISDQLNDIYERLDAMGAAAAQGRASNILKGLGFTSAMQEKATKDFSGGWRMRIALARALFLDPTLLVLDGPTAHLDMDAVVWFEEYLKKFKKILLLVSHSIDFMNGVCTNIILLRQEKLTYYSGNYSTYIKTREEKETNQQTQYDREQAEIAHMKDYIARFGHGSAKLAKQAQSKEKTLAKMERSGLTEAVTQDRVLKLKFENVGKIPPPVIQLQSVSFAYPAKDGKKPHLIYDKLDFGADLDSRIVLVGPNGAGKSTLLKLINGDLIPSDGMVRKHHHLRLAMFSQHSADQLPQDSTPLDFILKEFPMDSQGKPNTIEGARSTVGRFGVTGSAQMMKISQLSDGQKARVVFSYLAEKRPHFILFDEPSNSLDAGTTEALADAINAWDGGCIIVSHDLNLVQRVAKQVFICDKGKMTLYDGDIASFKKTLRKQMGFD